MHESGRLSSRNALKVSLLVFLFYESMPDIALNRPHFTLSVPSLVGSFPVPSQLPLGSLGILARISVMRMCLFDLHQAIRKPASSLLDFVFGIA